VSETRFVADVMLGKLARWLRALGYDTLYFRDAPDSRLLGIALRERRQLLTRDVGLAARAGAAGFLIQTEGLDAQLREVMAASGLRSRAPLSRCLECNGTLARRAPTEVRDRVPPYTAATQQEFWECAGCARVFWAGTHAEGILSRLQPYLASPPASFDGAGPCGGRGEPGPA
jgi:uncharacterized protein with PIN domain